MPGLIGFTDNQHKYDIGMLSNMRDLLKYSDKYVNEELYSDKDVYASRTHLGIIDLGKQPYCLHSRFCSWLEGEFYNQEELRLKYEATSKKDNELLLDIYVKTMSFDFLRDIDGYYASVIYDKHESTVHLITNRYGLKPLYWGVINDNLVWSSELKGFLGHKDFKINIDGKAVQQFFDIGYLLENSTWFDSIELVPPSSVLSFDIKKSKAEINHYWSWSEIKPINGPIDVREIAEELGRLFSQSVRKRVNKGQRIGITLSGGLDSRAILAAVPEDYKPLHTFTFGEEGCDDIRIAKKASEIKRAEHHALILHSDNWLIQRISGVWMSDGSDSLLHMHGMEFLHIYKKHINCSLNGFAGDLILGGSYLRNAYLDKEVCPLIIKEVTGADKVIEPNTVWYNIKKTDPYFINNRVRRFTNTGLILLGTTIETQIPFFDNTLIDFVYSFPDSLRYESHIYKKMLLNAFPEYFRKIPWQKTGYPISYSDQLMKVARFKNRIVNKLKHEAKRFGLNYADLHHYTDYPNWLRQEPARSFFENILCAKDAIYPVYVDRDTIQKYLNGHMKGKGNYHNELCTALTFEIWLKQVFEGRFRE